MPACGCDVCLSKDPRDKRLRTSLLLQSDTTTVVIDSSADFRQQMLTHAVRSLDAIVYTHYHIDHIGGFDDVRPFNFLQKRDMPIYANGETIGHLKRIFNYAFGAAVQSGGGLPRVLPHEITNSFSIGDLSLIPIPAKHGEVDVLGFRVGNMAYCTDMSFIPDSSMKLLEGVETLVLNALRRTPHKTHFNIEQACEIASIVGAKNTYFTHISHALGKHADVSQELPNGVKLAYDGLTFAASM